jgi:hypothetical protein
MRLRCENWHLPLFGGVIIVAVSRTTTTITTKWWLDISHDIRHAEYLYSACFLYLNDQ